MPQRYIWNNIGKEKFNTVMESTKIQERLDTFVKDDFNDIDEATDTLTNIILDVADQCLNKKSQSKKTDPHKRKNKGWNEDCSVAKKLFKNCKRDLHLDSKNINKKHVYLMQKKKYRKSIYNAQKIYKENRIRSLEGLEYKDPKTFWKTIKEFSENAVQSNSSNLISSSEWVNYYSRLFNATGSGDDSFQQYVDTSLPVIEKESVTNAILDNDVHVSETEML
jgi:hypothetical protein